MSEAPSIEAVEQSYRPRFAAGATVALAVLALIFIAVAERFDAGWSPPARWRLFDLYQRLVPREQARLNAAVVGIDEESFARYGPWPWPRDRLALMLERLAAGQPAVIGVDLLFPAPDVNDPARMLRTPGLSAALQRGLSELVEDEALPAVAAAAERGLKTLPSTDEALEFALFAAPVVLARRASLDREQASSSAPGAASTASPTPYPVKLEGPDPGDALARYAGSLPNLERLEAQARGLGFITVASADDDGVVRRVPLVVRVGEQLWPTLPVEMLRVALSERSSKPQEVVLETDAHGARAVRIGPWRARTDRAGMLRLYFGPPAFTTAGDERLTSIEISAATVLGGGIAADAFRAEELRDSLLIVGVTGLGRVDAVSTPAAGSTRGVYVHAETIENIISGQWLERPAWALWAEVGLGLGAIVLVGWLAPRTGRAATLGVVLGALAAIVAVSFLAFVYARVLLAPLLPVLALLIATAIVRGAMLADTRRRARALESALHREQVERARVAGELNAARAIQLGLLPDPGALDGLPGNVEVDALLAPAREVGGDLYDAFMLDEHRLFFVVGDVAGKGIPASLFMALGKTLCKSSALRDEADLESLVATANREISRDNPGSMFITALFGILDARSGRLEFCNAGHENPIVVSADGEVRSLETAGGPPLCLLDDFPYPADAASLAQGDTVVIVTDGITEAQNAAGELYGHARLTAKLTAMAGTAPSALIARLAQDVADHAAGTEPYDDLTVLAVRYAP